MVTLEGDIENSGADSVSRNFDSSNRVFGAIALSNWSIGAKQLSQRYRQIDRSGLDAFLVLLYQNFTWRLDFQ